MEIDPKVFLRIKRAPAQYRPVCERVHDYSPVFIPNTPQRSQEQSSRCMDCGTSFCHWGCPVGNYIPEWNRLVTLGNWKKAYSLLSAANNLPEITGRICPAMCEYACVLGINDEAVTIRENELAIIEYAFSHGIIKPQKPRSKTNKSVAIIGSGPAGLSAAAGLNQAGYHVVVFERDDKVGGIMRYGIPDFKLEKWILDRRISLMAKEGIEFVKKINVGLDYSAQKLKKDFSAVCLCGGSRIPRDLKIEGRNLKGIYFAMDYLGCANAIASGATISQNKYINAKDKNVVIIGGGDTGADCVGMAHRQGAKCVVQIELMPKPPQCRSKAYPWPYYPLILKTSSSHQEGGTRHWAVLTKSFSGKNGQLKKLCCARVGFYQEKGNVCPGMKEIPNSEFEIPVDLAILAIGFLHPEHSPLLEELKVNFDSRGNVQTDNNYMTKSKKIFSAGDMHRGQSLIVWAISEGRHAAHCIDSYLCKSRSNLPIL